MSEELLSKFWARCVISPDGCILWSGSIGGGGYGRFHLGGHDYNMTAAHRWIYQQLVGPIPDDKEIDHLCRVRNCVNVTHLEPVTHAENIRRGIWGTHQVEKTHCPKGHPYSAENTYNRPRRPNRECRTCRAAYFAATL